MIEIALFTQFIDDKSKNVLLQIGQTPSNKTDKIASTDNVFVALQDDSRTASNHKQKVENDNKAAAIIPPDDPDEEEEEKYDMKEKEELSRSGSNSPSHSSPLPSSSLSSSLS